MNQGGDAKIQGGNVSITVEITWNSNRNDKFIDWRRGAFLVDFDIFSTMSFCFYY